MRSRIASRDRAWRGFAAFVLVGAGALPALADDPSPSEIEALRIQVEALVDQNAEMRETIGTLRDDVRAARDDAAVARERATQRPPVGAPPASEYFSVDEPIWSTPAGQNARLQLMDVSLDVIWAAGGSTARDDELALLEGGGHDPRQRGFSLPQVELSLQGAVDPYLTGEVHLIYFVDTEGESRFELEEAFAETLMLPWELHERGFQLEFGYFFTEFGRLNPVHPHAWNWQDQPVILSRFLGEDGMRGPGVRLGWLVPVDWYSEIHVGAQTAKGETMVSFMANEEVFEERPIGGRPFFSAETRNPSDLVYLLRWVNGGDLTETLSAQVGASGLYGSNATGSEGDTFIYGLDWVLKWMPLQTDRGWPFIEFEGEMMRRDYHADTFSGCSPPEEESGAAGCDDLLVLGSDTLHDWGGYAQLVWGFRRGWATGIRYEYATGSGESVGVYDGRSDDPFRDDRHRVSPMLVFHPSEFSRIRLQYNYDRFEHASESAAHSVWLGVEFSLGAHAAHSY
jgi:outer membrane murein-binding lipoprotein Lpp